MTDKIRTKEEKERLNQAETIRLLAQSPMGVYRQTTFRFEERPTDPPVNTRTLADYQGSYKSE